MARLLYRCIALGLMMSALSVAGPWVASAAADAIAPLRVDRLMTLYEQFQYDPDYTRNVPSFDDAGVAYFRSATADAHHSEFVQTPVAGVWQRFAFEGALRASYPTFSRTIAAGGAESDRIIFDRQDRAYNGLTIELDDGSRRNVLMISWDHCRTWRVYELPHGGFMLERWVGHNEIDGPPLLAIWRGVGDGDEGGSYPAALWVTKPRLNGDELNIPELVKVTDKCLGLRPGYGGGTFAVTVGGRSFLTWSETSPSGDPRLPTYVAMYDAADNSVSPAVRVATSPGANDTHNIPEICVDSRGYLHVVTGTHGTPTLHTRSLEPLTTDAGWTPAEPVVSSGWATGSRESVGRQTYPGLVCDGDDTLHLVTRQWRRTWRQAQAGLYYGVLIHQSRPRDGVWSKPRGLIIAGEPGYCSFANRLTLDGRGRLMVVAAFQSDSDTWRTRRLNSEARVLDRPALGNDAFPRRVVLLSDDHGANWRLADDSDFGASSPAATRLGALPAPFSWTWHATRPQGNQITALDFVSGRYGWAVGTQGTILTTTVDGRRWRPLNSGTQARLFAVKAINRKVVWVAGSSGIALRTTDGGKTWRRFATGTRETLLAVSAWSEKSALVAGTRGVMRATTNGGKTWRYRSSGTNYAIYSLDFIDTRRGWYAAGWETRIGRVAFTSNGGLRWTKRCSLAIPAVYAVDFRDARTGVVVGEGGLTLRTGDGGRTWLRQEVAPKARLNGVRFHASRSSAVWASGAHGTVLRSRDGGATWEVVRPATPSLTMGAVSAGAGVVWAAGAGGRIIRSSDGGATWSAGTQTYLPSLRALTTTADGGLTAVGAGGFVWRATAAGSSLMRSSVAGGSTLNGVDRYEGDLWAVGDAGTVTHSGDDGRTWETSTLGSGRLAAVDVVDAETIWVAGIHGGLKSSADGGRSWRDRAFADDQDFTSLAFVDRDHGWLGAGMVLGQAQAMVWRTVDGGQTWQRATLPADGRVLSLHFADNQRGWAAVEDYGPDGDTPMGALLMTTDGGLSWRVRAKSPVPLHAVTIAARYGYAVGARGYTLVTTDGGLTWRATSTATDNHLRATLVNGDDSGWMVGDDGTVLLGRPR